MLRDLGASIGASVAARCWACTSQPESHAYASGAVLPRTAFACALHDACTHR